MPKMPMNFSEMHGMMSGHQGSVHSANYGIKHSTVVKGSPGPKKKGVGATHSAGAIKTALNIVTK